jgi:PAS domain S-box-containing protein
MSSSSIHKGRRWRPLSRAALWPLTWRYGLAVLGFILILLLAFAFRGLSIQFDFGFLIIAVLMAVAWYGGPGPGFTLALLLEIATLAMSNPRQLSWPRFLFAEFNRTVLLIIIAWLVSSRRHAETKLRQQHEHLRASEERFSKAFYASPVPMSIVTYQDGCYLDVNESFLRNSGYTREEIIGRTTTELGIYAIPGERDRLRRVLEGHGVILNLEVHRRIKSGEVRVGLTSSELITLNGERCILTTTNDITDRKQLEEQLVQAQKMEAIGRLAGGIAHDFNNLLTAIIGYSQLLLRRAPADDPSRQELEEIQKAGERAATLTGQLLAFSRRQVLQPKILDLNMVIADIGKMLQRLIGEDVELRTHFDLRIGLAKADPGQVEQVVMNLAVNARDAMPHGGKLTIETANAYLDESYAGQHAEVQPGPYIMLAMSDTGTGMDKQTQARIFEPFFTTKEQGKGTGLGLSTVYGIVRQSGGHISVYSEPGRGTTFKVYLPQANESCPARDPLAPAPELLSGTETVLIVEDEDAVRQLTQQVLKANGYTVLEASNPNDALGLAASFREQIHLLISDVVMPGMNGGALVSHLSQLRPTTRVLYISGYAEDAIVQHGILDSGTPFLPKPFTPDGLLRKVRKVLDGGR